MLKVSDEPNYNTEQLSKLRDSRARMKEMARKKSDGHVTNLNDQTRKTMGLFENVEFQRDQEIVKAITNFHTKESVRDEELAKILEYAV